MITKDCIRSGITAIKSIERVMLNCGYAGLKLPFNPQRETCPPYEVQHAYAITIGCDATCGLRWIYDFTEHEFYAYQDACAAYPTMTPERIAHLIKAAEAQNEDYMQWLQERALAADDIDAKPKKVRATCG